MKPWDKVKTGEAHFIACQREIWDALPPPRSGMCFQIRRSPIIKLPFPFIARLETKSSALRLVKQGFEEIVLLEVLGENGQCIYHLIYEDPE